MWRCCEFIREARPYHSSCDKGYVFIIQSAPKLGLEIRLTVRKEEIANIMGVKSCLATFYAPALLIILLTVA